jgi:hypothetical protein
MAEFKWGKDSKLKSNFNLKTFFYNFNFYIKFQKNPI